MLKTFREYRLHTICNLYRLRGLTIFKYYFFQSIDLCKRPLFEKIFSFFFFLRSTRVSPLFNDATLMIYIYFSLGSQVLYQDSHCCLFSLPYHDLGSISGRCTAIHKITSQFSLLRPINILKHMHTKRCGEQRQFLMANLTFSHKASQVTQGVQPADSVRFK